MSDNLPSRRIDREALEKIIQRAAELQAQEIDTGDAMTEADLLKLGAEVGIDGRYLRQALYEQGGGSPQEAGAVGKFFGPQRVYASRVVQGGKLDVETQLAHWMTEGEALAVKRRMPDRTIWEQQRGFMAQMKRGFGMGGRQYQLARAVDVTVIATQLESGYCHVELSADISHMRRGALGASLGGGGAMLLVGAGALPLVASLGVAAFPLSLLALVPIAGGIAAPVIAGRVQRTRAAQMQLALEQVLDRLEHGEIKPRHRDQGAPFLSIAAEIRTAIADGIEQGKQRKRLKGQQ